jgi:RNA polymerase sigma factor for flagellar operon FliA
VATADELILAHIDMPRICAARMSAHLSYIGMDLEDAVQEGCIALVRAAHTFDGGAHNGCSFRSWAWIKVNGGIRDAARAFDRSANGRTRAQAVAGDNTGRTWSLNQEIADGEHVIAELIDMLVDGSPDAHTLLERDEFAEALPGVMDGIGLTVQERTVVLLTVIHGCRLHHVADMFGVSESRMSQVRTKALAKLRPVLAAA